jgi:ribonuclease M5
MTDKIQIRELVVVEGRYDKIALSNIIDATILTTDGFSIFHKGEKREYLRKLGAERGVILLTDSDGGGKQIRAFLTGLFPPASVKHLYIPQIAGKEGRKKQRSKQGLLGVEGMSADTLRELFAPFATDAPVQHLTPVTKTDLYVWGLLGGDGSSEKRARLCQYLGLPSLTSNALAQGLSLLYGKEKIEEIIKEMF